MSVTTQTKRKIQYVAKSTYVVSLPKRWVEATIGEDPEEVKQKNLIIIPMQDGSLAIYPEVERVPVKSETNLRLDEEIMNNFDLFKKRLIAKYLVGHRQIRLTSEETIPPEIVKATEEIVRLFIGCEIVEINPNVIVIQDLLALGQLPIAQALNMMSLVARSATKSALHAIVTNNETMAREVSNLEDKVDQYHYLITRQLNSVLANPSLLSEHGLKLMELIEYHSVVQLLETIGDQAEDIAIDFLTTKTFPNFEEISKKPVFDEIISILKELNTKLTGVSKNAMDAFFERNTHAAYQTIQTCASFRPSILNLKALSYNLPRDFALNFVAIGNRLVRIADKLIAICEVAMDRAEPS